MSDYSIDDQFVNKESVVREIYEAMIDGMREWEGVHATPKKGSIHLDRGTSFGGVHTRKNYLNLNIRTATAIDSSRVRKVEQVSKNRFHNLVRLDAVSDVDAELLGWLHDAYLLSQ